MALPDANLTAKLKSEEECLAYLENLRWPTGVACPICGNQRISRFQAKGKSGKTRQICQCLNRDCKYQFSATTGTIFHDSHLPLSKWYEAIRSLADPANSTTVNHLRFILGVQYKTAKNVAEKIQRALDAGSIEISTGLIKAQPDAATAVKPSKTPPRTKVSISGHESTTELPYPRPAPGRPIPASPSAPVALRVRGTAQEPPGNPPAQPTVVDSMLTMMTSAINLSVKPPLAAVNYLKKKILD